jgi:hypothetical protein
MLPGTRSSITDIVRARALGIVACCQH